MTAIAIDTHTTNEKYATFYVRDLLLAVPIDSVQEINRHIEVTPVPGVSPTIRGVINLRGDVVSVIDLRKVLGLGSVEITQHTRNIVINCDGEHVGILVDRIADIWPIPVNEVAPPPANIDGVDGDFFSGVYTTDKDIVVLLNIQKALG